jgi:hypothetical protein
LKENQQRKGQIMIQLQTTKTNSERYRQKQRPNKIRQNNSQDDVSLVTNLVMFDVVLWEA